MAQKMMKRMPSGLEDGLEKMSPTEELGVEHGQLTRILLAMDNVLRGSASVPKANLGPINQACKMIRQSVVDHHMKIEEEHVYPRFEDTDLADCASTLKTQHIEARKLLAHMESLAKSGTLRDKAAMEELKRTFNDFKDMITAHAAFEETILFPVMEGTWSQKDLDNLREIQEEDEKKLMGDDAAEKTFEMLASLESSCGVTGLRDYTRRMK
ncbi:MAG TPA: hemerythrin domain-containing protein [Methanocella sp.]|jgi:hemerythrin-like domain-containing protein